MRANPSIERTFTSGPPHLRLPLMSNVRAPMKHIPMLAALLMNAPALAERGAEVCPLLPPGSGLTWTYADGADFGVCYASAPGSKATVFGIYLGNAPSFDPARATRVAAGHIAGKEVIWYRRDSYSGIAPLARQTVIAITNRYIAHIWVNADTEAQLQERLSILERIAFKH